VMFPFRSKPDEGPPHSLYVPWCRRIHRCDVSFLFPHGPVHRNPVSLFFHPCPTATDRSTTPPPLSFFSAFCRDGCPSLSCCSGGPLLALWNPPGACAFLPFPYAFTVFLGGDPLFCFPAPASSLPPHETSLLLFPSLSSWDSRAGVPYLCILVIAGITSSGNSKSPTTPWTAWVPRCVMRLSSFRGACFVGCTELYLSRGRGPGGSWTPFPLHRFGPRATPHSSCVPFKFISLFTSPICRPPLAQEFVSLLHFFSRRTRILPPD